MLVGDGLLPSTRDCGGEYDVCYRVILSQEATSLEALGRQITVP